MRKEIPVQQGEKYEITIKTLGASGEGVGRAADFTVFVLGALPGERVLVRIDEVKKTYARGKLVEILEKSPQRISPACPIYDFCAVSFSTCRMRGSCTGSVSRSSMPSSASEGFPASRCCPF